MCVCCCWVFPQEVENEVRGEMDLINFIVKWLAVGAWKWNVFKSTFATMKFIT